MGLLERERYQPQRVRGLQPHSVHVGQSFGKRRKPLKAFFVCLFTSNNEITLYVS